MNRRVEALPALTGVRALAALWVLTFHLAAPTKTLFPALRGHVRLVDAGYLGVDVFFVLSGFVLAHAYAERMALQPRALARFFWFRLARVWPLHAAVTLGLAAACFAAPYFGLRNFASSPLFDRSALPAQLALVQAWVSSNPTWNVPSWSVSCEWAAYLAFPFVCLAAGSVRRPAVLLGIAAAVVVGFVVYDELLHAGSLDLTYQAGLARIACEFTLGVVLERATRLAETKIADGWLVMAAAVIAIAAWRGSTGPWLVAPIALFVVGLARNQGRVAAALSHRWAVWAGERSYAIYLVHGPVMLLAMSAAAPASFAARSVLVRACWPFAVLVGTVIGAAAAFRFVEEPARKVMRVVFEGRRGRAAKEAAPPLPSRSAS